MIIPARTSVTGTDPARSTRLNERDYNMVAYAWGLRYQQSNQWALETLSLAAEPGIASRHNSPWYRKYTRMRLPRTSTNRCSAG